MTLNGLPAIRLDHLTKQYGRLVALKGVSLEVEAGEIFGFLGLNGAGKTTTIRILLDLVRATSGRAFVLVSIPVARVWTRAPASDICPESSGSTAI